MPRAPGVDPFADPELEALRPQVRALCMRFPTRTGASSTSTRSTRGVRPGDDRARLAGRADSRAYGGLGLRSAEAAAILQEINQPGGNAGPGPRPDVRHGHAAAHGSEEQKAAISRHRRRRAAPAGVRGDRTRGRHRHHPHRDRARLRDGDDYVITGRKIYISRVQHSDLMVLLARTSPRDEARPTRRAQSSSWSICARPATASAPTACR